MNDKPVVLAHDQEVALRRGRLIFALDATGSRAPTWALARELQAEMFQKAAPIGRPDVQLVYYRGVECKASRWKSSGPADEWHRVRDRLHSDWQGAGPRDPGE